jgi:hypothetical protein
MLEKHGIACDLMHGFNWDKWTSGTPTERLQLIPAGQEHILEQEDGKQRFVQVVTELSRAFALCAVQAMGDAKLKVIAAELITQVKKSVTIDWTLRESARAKIKVMVKRILNKHGYPPDLQEEAVKTVLAQAELLCAEWV